MRVLARQLRLAISTLMANNVAATVEYPEQITDNMRTKLNAPTAAMCMVLMEVTCMRENVPNAKMVLRESSTGSE
jgi:hypothetical protein